MSTFLSDFAKLSLLRYFQRNYHFPYMEKYFNHLITFIPKSWLLVAVELCSSELLFVRKRKPHWSCDVCVGKKSSQLTSLGRPCNRTMTTHHRRVWVLLNLKLRCHSSHHTKLALAPGHSKASVMRSFP